MLIYEITVVIEPELKSEFERYMSERHIPDLLATGKFAAAFFARSESEYRIGYHCNSKADFDNYLANDAEGLRADFASHFPDRISVSRKVLDIVALFPSPK